MFKFYILTSGGQQALARQFHTFRTTDVVVVINTLDKEYETRIYEWCQKLSIECHITKSDGTAATGKNSVLKLFLESDNEYMVHVDGDDFITPYGKNMYRTTANLPNPPDVIALYNQLALEVYRKGVWDDQYDSLTVKTDGMYVPQALAPQYPHDYTTTAQSYGDPEQLTSMYMTQIPDLDYQTASDWGHARAELNKLFKKYGERDEGFNRLTFLSRKAAKLMYYDNTLIVGEDTYQFYKLKSLAYDGIIDMRMRNERWAFSYVYLSDKPSITKTLDLERKLFGMIDYSWQLPLLESLNRLIPTLPVDFTLPEFYDPHYEVNKK